MNESEKFSTRCCVPKELTAADPLYHLRGLNVAGCPYLIGDFVRWKTHNGATVKGIVYSSHGDVIDIKRKRNGDFLVTAIHIRNSGMYGIPKTFLASDTRFTRMLLRAPNQATP